MPRTLTALVAQRMAELDPDAQRVLQAAALLGEEPDWSLLGPLTGLDGTVVSTGLRAGTGNGLLSRRDVRLIWRHSLTRAAVVSGMLPTERAALVDRAADLLLARGTSDDDALAADLLAEAGESASGDGDPAAAGPAGHGPGRAARRRRPDRAAPHR